MSIGLSRIRTPWLAAALGAGLLSACGVAGEPDGAASDSENILADTVGDTSGSGTGEPGTACGVDVFANPVGVPDPTAESTGPNGLLITNVATDHPFITPNLDGKHDGTVFVADARFANPGDTNIYDYLVNWTVSVTSGASCVDVGAILTGQSSMTFSTGSTEVSEDFEAAAAGSSATAFDGFSVACENRQKNHPDECVVFDTQASGVERGLSTDSRGNVLVVAKNDRGDDESLGGTVTLTFDEPVTLRSIGLLDVDRGEQTKLTVITSSGASTTTDVPSGKNGDWQDVVLDASDVVSVIVELDGSAAITDVKFAREGGAGEGHASFETEWDATDAAGDTVADGGYIFTVSAELVRSDGLVMDSVASEHLGLMVDAGFADYSQAPELSTCDDTVDPNFCECAVGDTSCSFTFLDQLNTFETDPAAVASSFVTTSYDAATGRYHVVADLTNFNGGGLIPKMSGVWASAAELQAFVSAVTGVPASSDGRLLNFDYTQIGVSTGVTATGFANESFNDLILDLITDTDGYITIGGETTYVLEGLNFPVDAPAEYLIPNSRQNQECTEAGGFNGDVSAAAKFCVYADALRLDSTTDLGLYVFRQAAFDLEIDGVGVSREISCNSDGCSVRTFQQVADFTIDSIYYTSDGTTVVEDFFDQAVFSGASLSRTIDRGAIGSVLSGSCSRAVVEASDLRVRLDSADGAVADNCIINGIF